jgi:hypothetical protein
MEVVEGPNYSIRPAVIEVVVENIKEKSKSAIVDPGATVNAIR